MLKTLSETCASWGFSALETPVLEYADVLGKYLPDEERPDSGVFSIRENEQWLALRYDLTAPLARYVAENYDSLSKPFRRYQYGPVFRNEKPDPGRFRQFMQFDADVVGASAPLADAELCALAAKCMDNLGLEKKYLLHISNRKLLDGLLESIGIEKTSPNFAKQRLRVLRSIDKMERLGMDAVEQLLRKGRRDISGDVTQGAGLSPESTKQVLVFVGDALENLEDSVGCTPSGAQGIEELYEMRELILKFGVDDTAIVIDPSIVRGLEYYTGPIFEIQLDGIDKSLKRFGSVGGGGRYDDLITRFKGTKIPAAGFSIGVSRLHTVLEAMKKPSTTKEKDIDVVVLLLDPADKIEAVQMTQELREAGICAEVYLGSGKMRAQMRYADHRNAKLVIIQGKQEREHNEVSIRDLVLGKTLSDKIKKASAWKEGGMAQQTIPRNRLVAEVCKILNSRNE